jgi:hypothetical protein
MQNRETIGPYQGDYIMGDREFGGGGGGVGGWWTGPLKTTNHIYKVYILQEKKLHQLITSGTRQHKSRASSEHLRLREREEGVVPLKTTSCRWFHNTQQHKSIQEFLMLGD